MDLQPLCQALRTIDECLALGCCDWDWDDDSCNHSEGASHRDCALANRLLRTSQRPCGLGSGSICLGGVREKVGQGYRAEFVPEVTSDVQRRALTPTLGQGTWKRISCRQPGLVCDGRGGGVDSSAGWYTTTNANGLVVSQVPCDEGFFCNSGMRFHCGGSHLHCPAMRCGMREWCTSTLSSTLTFVLTQRGPDSSFPWLLFHRGRLRPDARGTDEMSRWGALFVRSQEAVLRRSSERHQW